MTSEEVREQVKRIRWWHQIDLGQGIITPGEDDTIRRISELGLPEDLSRKTVLDIGAWDGAFSFEAERRGASRVLAIDEYIWAGKGWASKAGFDFARRVLNSKVEDMLLDVYDLSPERVGQFDLVLFAGVLYHLRHPLLALELVASVTADHLILSTHVDLINLKRPAMAFYPGGELNKDSTNWWGPNLPALEAMLRSVGFGDVSLVASSPLDGTSVDEIYTGWATVHAWKYLTEISFCGNAPANAHIEGFYEPESWGTWSQASRVAITLDRPVAGNVVFSLTGFGYGPNIRCATTCRSG